MASTNLVNMVLFCANPLTEINANLLSIIPFQTKFSEIWIKIQQPFIRKLHLKLCIKISHFVQGLMCWWPLRIVIISKYFTHIFMIIFESIFIQYTQRLVPQNPTDNEVTWWRHQMETFSALLAICAGNSPHKGQWRRALMFSLICARRNSWVNNGEAGDLRRHLAHYDVTVMHWSRQWLGPLGTSFYQNMKIFLQGNAFENVICKMASILFQPQSVNSFRPSDAYMRQ